MRNNEKTLLGLTCFLGGVVIGFLIAPVKKGIYCGNNCGNHVRSSEELKEFTGKSIEENENFK